MGRSAHDSCGPVLRGYAVLFRSGKPILFGPFAPIVCPMAEGLFGPLAPGDVTADGLAEMGGCGGLASALLADGMGLRRCLGRGGRLPARGFCLRGRLSPSHDPASGCRQRERRKDPPLHPHAI
jgi:hypothetical protein